MSIIALHHPGKSTVKMNTVENVEHGKNSNMSK